MTFKTLIAAACLSVMSATASLASTLDFNFSFSDGTNTVTGLITGLTDDATGPASSIEVLSNTLGYGLGPITTSSNLFTVTAGDITFASVQGNPGTQPVVLELQLTQDAVSFAYLRNFDPNQSVRIDTAPTFTAIDPVPLPAGAVLLATGLFGLTRLARKPHRT